MNDYVYLLILLYRLKMFLDCVFNILKNLFLYDSKVFLFKHTRVEVNSILFLPLMYFINVILLKTV